MEFLHSIDFIGNVISHVSYEYIFVYTRVCKLWGTIITQECEGTSVSVHLFNKLLYQVDFRKIKEICKSLANIGVDVIGDKLLNIIISIPNTIV